MDKELLSQINSTRKEIEELREKIDNINNKPAKIVIDSVKGSSASYPYIQHNCVIEGLDNKKIIANKKSRNKYKKQIKNKEFKLMKLITNLEYELNNVEDSEIRRIIRHKYEDYRSQPSACVEEFPLADTDSTSVKARGEGFRIPLQLWQVPRAGDHT